MNSKDNQESIRDLLAAYALNALDGDDLARVLAALPHLTSEEQELLDGYETVAGLLGSTVTGVAPPPELEEILLQKIAAEKEKMALNADDIMVIRGNQSDWKTIFPGIEMKVLSYDSARAASSVLLSFAAGSSLPAHVHNGREEVFVLEGECTINGEKVAAGDYLVAATGSVHQTVHFEVPCRIFAILPGIEFINN